MARKTGTLRFLTESLPLAVYNHMFSQQPELNGAVCYYDAKVDDYIREFQPLKASEVKVEEDMQKKSS